MTHHPSVIKLVILDRDGVINYDSPCYIKSPDEWQAIPGSLEAIARLSKAGYKIAVATNQSGIARGLYNIKTLATIHARMCDEVSKVGGVIDKIVFCPHTPEARCPCRKPKPQLLLQIAEYFGCSLRQVPFIGDKMSDVEAAIQAGAKPILIAESQLKCDAFDSFKLVSYPSLSLAVDHIIGASDGFST